MSYGARSIEKEKKQQHINGTENILLKGCTTISAQNFYQKSSEHSCHRGRRTEGFVNTDPAESRHLRFVSRDRRRNLYSNEELVDMLIEYEVADCSRPSIPQRNLWTEVDRLWCPGSLAYQFTNPIKHGLLLLGSYEQFGEETPVSSVADPSIEYL
ncbi:hypothetical protein TNCV_331331 [Trichonephila clavipes]|nr:hypothetical protein TNCV_331331 [Trichonephila clavipes]